MKRNFTNRGRKISKRKPRINNKERNRKRPIIVRLSKVGEFSPEQLIVPIRFVDTQSIRTNNGVGSANWHFRTSAYDPDPAFGTGAIPGFNEIAAFYQYYRVHSMEIDMIGVNGETTTPLRVTIWPSVVSVAPNTLSNVSVEERGQGPFGFKEMIDRLGSGQGKFYYKKKFTTSEISGERAWKDDPNYSALTNGNPTTVWWLNIGLAPTIGTLTTTGGLHTNMSIVYEVEFFGRLDLAT